MSDIEMDNNRRKGLLCGLIAAGLRLEGLLRVAMERPDTEAEIAPQLNEAFEFYSSLFRQIWPVESPGTLAPEPQPITEPQPVAESEPVCEPVCEQVCEPVCEHIQEPVPVIEVAEVSTPAPEQESKPVETPRPLADTLKVDELIARKETADLRRAFTLNDKFRFRRTLFGGSDARFGAMLDNIEKAKDFTCAEQLILAELDAESEDYEDFMNIIKSHFGLKL